MKTFSIGDAAFLIDKLKFIYLSIIYLSKFLYLVQIDICIPNYLSSPNILGDWQACDCELLVPATSQDALTTLSLM